MPNGNPILPRHPTNPVGQTRRVENSKRFISKRLRRIKKWLKETFDDIPTVNLTANAGGLTVNRYEYEISIPELRRIIAEIQRRFGDIPDDDLIHQAQQAYAEGTAQSVANLSRISDDYTRTVTAVLASQPWQRRVALVGARVFEEMEGFKGESGHRLGGLLMRAVESGRNPLDVSKDISREFGIARRRSERIARTEITGALRRARWDEAQDAQERVGVRTKLMHFSALSPTTRPHHAARHGLLYNIDEVREWYAVDGNAINCKCSQIEVLVDRKGEPRTPKVVERVKDAKRRFIERQDG